MKLFHAQLESAIGEYIRRKSRTEYWKELLGLRKVKILLGDYDHRKNYDNVTLSRNGLGVLTGILTGHCRLEGPFSRLGLVELGNVAIMR